MNENAKSLLLYDNVYRISELGKNPDNVTVFGMLLGISRKRSFNSNDNKTPYTLHMTDFTKHEFNLHNYFDDRNFRRKELKNKTYDIVIFKMDFEKLCERVKYVNLHEKIRYYKYSNGRIMYEDEDIYEDEYQIKNNWLLENFHIWIAIKVKGKYFNNKLELVSLYKFEVIPVEKLLGKLKIYQLKDIWDNFVKIYENTEVFDDIFPESEDEIDEIDEIEERKRYKDKKLKENIVIESIPPLKKPKILNNKDRNINILNIKKFDNGNYTLIKELDYSEKKYKSQYIIVNKISILKFYDSYVYMHHNKLGIKPIKIEVYDEEDNVLILTIKGNKVCEFLKISLEGFNFFEDLNDKIKENIKLLSLDKSISNNEKFNNKSFYGMLISYQQVSTEIFKWCWEYTTINPIT